MNELRQWLERQARREERAVYLEEALLGNRFWAYAWYRLRYFFARYVVASLTHAVTVLLLYRFFDTHDFALVLVVYAAASVLSGFWWGALEAMRAEVRRLYRRRSPHLIPKAIGRWLSLSAQLTILSGIATAVVLSALAVDGRLEPAELYVVAILLGFSVQFFTRAYHSGVYAIRRIYRPLPAIAGVELVGITVAVALVPVLGAWALPVGALVSVPTVAGLSLHFTRRAYWFLGFRPASFVSIMGNSLPPRRTLRDFLGGGLSYGLAGIDSLLVLVLFSTESGGGKSGLFALFFLLSPTVRACAEWAQLMYFDFKRLEIRLFRNLRRRFERGVLRLAVVLGVLFSGVAIAVAAVVYRGSLGGVAWTLVPFFVSVSLLASVQMGAYAERAYGTLAVNAGLCLVGYVAVGVLVVDELATVLLLTAVSFACFLLLELRREPLHSDSEPLPWPTEWLAELRALDGPVRVAAARFYADAHDDEGRWRRRQVAIRLSRALRRSGSATEIEPGLLAWYERSPGRPALGSESLPSVGGGLVEWLGSCSGEDGLSALRAAASDGLLGSELSRVARRNGSRPRGADELRASFQGMFRSGIVYRPDEPIPARLDALRSEDKRSAVVDAVAFARELRVSHPRSRFQVTAFCPAGELQMLFLVSRRAPRRLCARWEALIRQANLQAAVSPPGP